MVRDQVELKTRGRWWSDEQMTSFLHLVRDVVSMPARPKMFRLAAFSAVAQVHDDQIVDDLSPSVQRPCQTVSKHLRLAKYTVSGFVFRSKPRPAAIGVGPINERPEVSDVGLFLCGVVAGPRTPVGILDRRWPRETCAAVFTDQRLTIPLGRSPAGVRAIPLRLRGVLDVLAATHPAGEGLHRLPIPDRVVASHAAVQGGTLREAGGGNQEVLAAPLAGTQNGTLVVHRTYPPVSRPRSVRALAGASSCLDFTTSTR
jgi:hypothetical protein